MKKAIFSIACCITAAYGIAQSDTARVRPRRPKIVFSNDTSVFFTGTRIADKEDSTEYHHITIGGYVSSYYAHYSDDTNIGGFVQFPTMAARNNDFGLNIAQLAMTYRSKRVRSNITLHYGDIPQSTWPKPFNLIQEAHAGIKLVNRLWFDAGFFRTHIGIESVQPRENVTSSMAVLTYYEPYYLSGAKLTYEVSPQLSVQLNVFDGFNTYIDNNSNKAVGLSAVYDPNEHISFTYNFLTCDETPDGAPVKHQRYFNNLYGSLKLNRFSLGFEANYAWQEHSLKSDTTQTASMYSGLLIARYQLVRKLAAYGRGEYFSDPDRIFTGALSIGKNIYGGTFGLEYHPLRNASISAETRVLQASNTIFRHGATYTNQRYEYTITMDVWF